MRIRKCEKLGQAERKPDAGQTQRKETVREMKRFCFFALAAVMLCVAVCGQAESFREIMEGSTKHLDTEAYRKTVSLLLKQADGRNEKLDAAFATDHLLLKKIERPKITAQDLEISDALWDALGMEKPEDEEAQLADALAQAEIMPLSISPKGNSGLYTAGGTWFAGYEGKYHPLFPSQSRGAADTYGNLKTCYQRAYINPRMLGEEGVVYSADGRYAALCNIRLTLYMGNYFLDPIIIDLSTGELILTASYASRAREEKMGVMATAVFSSDGYFYYILYGNTTEDRNALYRYDLENGKTELCCSIPWFAYFPQLSETEMGSFLVVEDNPNMSQTAGIIEISREDGAWKAERHPFSLETRFWYVRRILCSRSSGYAFCVGDYAARQFNLAFMVVRPDAGYAGLNEYHALPGDAQTAVSFTQDEYTAAMQQYLDEADGKISVLYESIQAAALSPDGYYALLLTTGAEGERHLRLLQLETLEYREVQGADPAMIPLIASAASYPPLIEWNGDTLLILQGNQVETYSFDW